MTEIAAKIRDHCKNGADLALTDRELRTIIGSLEGSEAALKLLREIKGNIIQDSKMMTIIKDTRPEYLILAINEVARIMKGDQDDYRESDPRAAERKRHDTERSRQESRHNRSL